jgi:uncharacterized membrane protein
MEFKVIMLLLLAAIIHSSWNVLVKKSCDKQVFLYLALVMFSVVFFVPFFIIYKPISLIGWQFIIVSGALETAYYLLLGGAYQKGDMSQVYPLARGMVPLFVTIIAFFS